MIDQESYDIDNQNLPTGVMVISKLEHIMTAEEVHKFYSHLEQETYFLDLVEYMTSGPSVALVLAKANPGRYNLMMLHEKFIIFVISDSK